MEEVASATALRWAVVFSGIYHLINPGIGWPLAVSAALMDRRQSSFFKAIVALAIGHLLSMAAILFPFSVMYVLVDYQREIQNRRRGIGHRDGPLPACQSATS